VAVHTASRPGELLLKPYRARLSPSNDVVRALRLNETEVAVYVQQSPLLSEHSISHPHNQEPQ